VDRNVLTHLDTFAEAAESGSFTAAARALGLTQAAVSQRVQALERDLGVALFRRQGGRASLTDAGRLLYSFAHRILALHAEARRAVAGRPRPVVGNLTLAASSVPGEHLLPALLAAFGGKYPQVRVRVTVSDSQAVMDQVGRGRADLGLVGGMAARPHLEFRPFACDHMVLVVGTAQAPDLKKRLSLRALCRQPLILREVGSASRWCLEQALARAGRSVNDLNVVLELGSNEAIKEAVQRGIGAAVLSEQVVEKEVRAGRLLALRVTGLCLKRDMYVVWDRRRMLPIPARLFLDFIAPRPHAADQP
jgi:DNA-binding transcriptional LysR family regulator